MSATRYRVDANILPPFLTGKPAAQAEAARKLFTQAADGNAGLDVSPVLVAEAFYKLHSSYGVERKTAAGKQDLLLRQRGVWLRDDNAIFSALNVLQNRTVGFAEAFLAAMAREEEASVTSFDRDFDQLSASRYEPEA